MDSLSELEKKVDALVKKMEQLRQENAGLKESALQHAEELAKIKSENSSLQNELDLVKSSTQENQEKLLAATDKIKSIIAKIDAA
jgi:predicted nuclease with TOPRIM domain